MFMFANRCACVFADCAAVLASVPAFCAASVCVFAPSVAAFASEIAVFIFESVKLISVTSASHALPWLGVTCVLGAGRLMGVKLPS